MRQTIMVRGRRYALDDPALQAALASIYRSNERPFCMCREEGVPMTIALYSDYVIKRLPDSGPQHHPSCPSFEPPPSFSGLSQLLGDAVCERGADGLELRVAFPLARRHGLARTAPTGAGDAPADVAAPRRLLTLRGLTDLLWERAGLHRWYPAMKGKRSWALVQRLLMQEAAAMSAKGEPMSAWLYAPEPFSADEREALASARQRALQRLRSPGDNSLMRYMVIIAPLKDAAPALGGDYRITLRHMPDTPLLTPAQVWQRAQRVYASLLDAAAVDSALRLLVTGLMYERRENIYQLERLTLTLLTEDWLPVGSLTEASCARQLVAAERAFLKPLAYELRRPEMLPTFLLLDAGDKPITLDLVSAADRERATRVREREQEGGWVWHTAGPMPALPPQNRRKREAAKQETTSASA